MENNNDISEEYLLLFNTITDTEKELSELSKKLVAAQKRAEEMYIMAGSGHKNMVTLSALPHVNTKNIIKKLHNIKRNHAQHFLLNHFQQRNACHT